MLGTMSFQLQFNARKSEKYTADMNCKLWPDASLISVILAKKRDISKSDDFHN